MAATSKTGKTLPADSIPKVEVAVAVIVRNGCDLLLGYNENWAAFTLPMTRPQVWRDDEGNVIEREEWADAGARAAAEVLGRPCFVTPIDTPSPIEFIRSGREGIIKAYSYHVFRVVDVGDCEEPSPLHGVATAWVQPNQVMQGGIMPGEATGVMQLRPLSETVRELVAFLDEHTGLFE